jgi:DNA end-binding protein Ku
MAPRSNWKGYLKLSLVSASIAIYPATSSSEKVRFNTLNRATGNRLKRQMVDSVTGDVVENEEMIKGYAIAKDQYVTVEDDELAEIAIESSHTVDIEKFVPKTSIDDRFRDAPYYLAPEDKVGQEAFAVIRDAMKKKKMVGIARVVMARRERVMMLEPFGKGIMGTTLLYPYEIRSDEAVFEEIPEVKLPDQMLGLAEHIIDKMTGEFNPEEFEDRYENAMIELIRSKQAGLPAPKERRRLAQPTL